MTDKPQQQQTLSVRISEALRQRLERAKKLMSSRTGESVSTSEIAKQLLESAREDRLEVVDLMSEPTKALREIRRKGEAQHVLSKAEWVVLAHFVQRGLEAFSSDTPSHVSRESLIAVLDAFSAAYDVRKGQSASDEYYLGNLPWDCRPSKVRTTEGSEKVTLEIVRRTVAETRRQLSDPSTRWEPGLIGRNLYAIIEDEGSKDAETLNRALRPHWSALWRLATRGHYHLTKEPVRDRPTAATEKFFQASIPPISEGGFTLSFARGEGNDFSVLLSFPGARAPMYPLADYPVMSEFRAMLATLDPDGPAQHWKGEYFFGYLGGRGKEAEFSFRARNNGITVSFTKKEWKAVRELFRRGWELPAVREMWDGLILEYGEL
ncbi:MAG TPA: hypothetical protein VGF61_05715 [Candidatus Acidoferrum sp.]